MTNSRRTYYLAPTFDSDPEGPIALGNIIKHPKEPDFCLNSRPPAATRVHVTVKHNQSIGRNHDRQVSGGIIASFLSSIGLGGNLVAGRGRGTSQRFNIPVMETQRITPDTDYFTRAVRDRRVQEYLTRRGLFRKDVYMITGIIIARGASGLVEEMRSRNIRGYVAINLTATGAPVEIGPSGSYATRRTRHESFDAASDFVLAYSLRKISYSSGGRVKDKLYNKGAYMESSSGSNQQDEETIDDSRLTIVNADAATFGDVNVVTDSDGEEEIECVVLT